MSLPSSNASSALKQLQFEPIWPLLHRPFGELSNVGERFLVGLAAAIERQQAAGLAVEPVAVFLAADDFEDLDPGPPSSPRRRWLPAPSANSATRVGNSFGRSAATLLQARFGFVAHADRQVAAGHAVPKGDLIVLVPVGSGILLSAASSCFNLSSSRLLLIDARSGNRRDRAADPACRQTFPTTWSSKSERLCRTLFSDLRPAAARPPAAESRGSRDPLRGRRRAACGLRESSRGTSIMRAQNRSSAAPSILRSVGQLGQVRVDLGPIPLGLGLLAGSSAIRLVQVARSSGFLFGRRMHQR